MNIALKKPDGKEYYLAVVRRENGHYVAQGKCVRSSGRLREMGRPFTFDSQKDAERKCRGLARTKVKRKQYRHIQLCQLPKCIVSFLEHPPEMQLSVDEMIALLKEARHERYVVFKDVSGLEEYFDVGVEYLGLTTKDRDTMKVYDRFGDARHVFVERLESVRDTERCVEMRMMDGHREGHRSTDTRQT